MVESEEKKGKFYRDRLKKLDWSIFPGGLYGSAQPGYNPFSNFNDQKVLEKLKRGLTPEEAGVDKELIEQLNLLNQSGIYL